MGSGWRLAGSAVFGLAVSGLAALEACAEVATDGTLGARTALAGPNYAVTADLGRQVGTNLFHSFTAFNLLRTESATFSGPASVSNVIGRVTGGTASSIDGLLRSTIPGASLWLINPGGFALGPNAAFDVPASLHLSTAGYLKLSDGGRFDASDPAASILSSAAPSAFGFVGPVPAPIRITGNTTSFQQWSVGDGQSLTFTGGEITASAIALAAPAGRIELTSVASAGEVPAGASSAPAPDGLAFGSIDLTGVLAEVNSSATGASGVIRIRGGRIVARDTALNAFNFTALPGGEVTVEASVSLSVQAGGISSIAAAGGAGNRIAIRAPVVELADAAEVKTLSFAGTAGDIEVDAGRLSVSGGSQLSTASLGSGTAGAIRVQAAEISLDHGSIANDTGGTGNAGTTSIQAETLRLANDGALTTITKGAGRGGDISIGATTIEISGGRAVPGGVADPVTGLTYAGLYSGIYSTSQGAASGAGGTVQISAGALRIADGGTISGVTLGGGNAGTVGIAARSISLDGGGLIHTSTAGTGAAGSIGIAAAGSLVATGLLDTLRYAGFAPRGSPASGIVSKATTALNPLSAVLGNGGTITIAAPSIALARGAEISTSAEKNAMGGHIGMTAGSVELASGASVASESLGTGNAGSISIRADDALRLSGGAALTTQARLADGGDISIRVGRLIDLQNSRITTAVGSGLGNGGNIDIDPQFLVLNHASIIANSFGGNGGNITIAASNFLRSPDSVVSASSQLGVSGTIVISSPAVDVSASLVDLVPPYLSATTLLASACATRLAERSSSLVLAARGGVPYAGDGFVPLFNAGAASPPLARTGGAMHATTGASFVRSLIRCNAG